MPTVAPSAIREAIGKQRTVPHSVAALLRAVCSHLYAAADSGDTAPLMALADDIAANGAMWSGAVTQNTPAAAQNDSMAMDHTLVPNGMADVFAAPGTQRVALADKAAADKAAADTARAEHEHEQQQDERKREQDAADKARADKATADKATADKAAADKARADQQQRDQQAQQARDQPEQRDRQQAADRARETPTERTSD